MPKKYEQNCAGKGNTLKRVLILGINGGLGQTFQTLLKGLYDVEGHDRNSCDVTLSIKIERVIKDFQPDVVINCAAYTAVDKAEQESPLAMATNFESVETLARLSDIHNFELVHFSTDYIFDGKTSKPYTENEAAHPLNIYGLSKLKGEQIALKNPRALVLRTSWLYSEYGKSFPEKILTKAIAGENLKVVSDQFSTPTYAYDLANATLDLISKNKSGLFNYSCEGVTNWHEFASETIRLFNKIKVKNYPLPTEIKTQDLKLPAARPLYSALDITKARQAGVIIRPWQKALEHYLNNLIELKFD